MSNQTTSTSSSTITVAPSTAGAPATPAGAIDDDDSASQQYDSTRLLVIFVIVVFFVLLLFILIYYYFVRRLKADQNIRLTMKSTSGSVTDEKARNIFAHPERHLAVDQSRRASPASSSSADGHDSALNGASLLTSSANNSEARSPQPQPPPPPPAALAEELRQAPKQAPKQIKEVQQRQQVSLSPGGTISASKSKTTTTASTTTKQINVAQTKLATAASSHHHQPPLLQPAPPPPQPIASGTKVAPAPAAKRSEPGEQTNVEGGRGTKSKSKSGSKGMTVVGTLANLRDTLKDHTTGNAA